jgi:hypothetical protein
MTCAGSGAEIGIVKCAGVKIPVCDSGTYAAQAHMDAHQSGKVHFQLRHGCTGSHGSVIAGKGENSLAAAGVIHDDGVRDAEGTAVGGAVRSGTGSAGRMSRGTTAAANHHRTGIKGRRSCTGINDPEFAQLVADKKAAAGEVVDRSIGLCSGAARAGDRQSESPVYGRLSVETACEDATDAVNLAVVAGHKRLVRLVIHPEARVLLDLAE